jgi:hypothetical protein
MAPRVSPTRGSIGIRASIRKCRGQQCVIETSAQDQIWSRVDLKAGHPKLNSESHHLRDFIADCGRSNPVDSGDQEVGLINVVVVRTQAVQRPLFRLSACNRNSD